MDGGDILETILSELRTIGYSVDWRVYNTRSLLPQQRTRIYILGLRQDLPRASEPFEWPEIPVLQTSFGGESEEVYRVSPEHLRIVPMRSIIAEVILRRQRERTDCVGKGFRIEIRILRRQVTVDSHGRSTPPYKILLKLPLKMAPYKQRRCQLHSSSVW